MPYKSTKSRAITFSLPPEMADEARRVRDEEGRDMSELVREALRFYLEERELRRQATPERPRSRGTEGEENGGEETDE